jgi:electron transfer flavoprotein beta subunit
MLVGLNIIVCVKSVVLDAPDGIIVRTTDSCALNPFDRPAIEAAIKLREEEGGQITALSMGPEAAGLGLYEALSMGIDQAVLFSDPKLAGSDTLATSTALGSAIKKLGPYDLVIFGARTSDSDTGQVGPQTAVYLGLPLVAGVFDIRPNASSLIVERRMDEFIERYEIALPGIITIHPSAFQPRDSSLMEINEAFTDKMIRKMSLDQLDLSPEQVGNSGSPTRVLAMKKVSRERKCEFIAGPMEEQAEELTQRLKETGLIG